MQVSLFFITILRSLIKCDMDYTWNRGSTKNFLEL